MGRYQRSGRATAILLMALMMLTAVFTLASCVGEDSFGPEIVDVEVSPNTFSQSDVMTDEFIDVTIFVSGFEGEIVEADVFIQLEGDDRVAQKDDFELAGDSIALVGIDRTWFVNLDPGTYDIGAEVVTEFETVIQRDLATLVITD